MERVLSQVLETKDYSKFKLMKGNRKPNSTNINHIIESMKEKQLLIPIIVNEKYEIIDGQHRFNAARILNLPVQYIVNKGYDITDVIRANVNGGLKWFDSDYLNRYIELEDPKYMDIKDIISTHRISVTEYIRLTAILQNRREKEVKTEFREGAIDNSSDEKLIQFLEDLSIFNTFAAFKTTAFMIGFLKLYMYKGYSHKTMESKFKLHARNLTHQRTIDEYVSVLCNKIYSVGNSKSPIYFSVESKKFHK